MAMAAEISAEERDIVEMRCANTMHGIMDFDRDVIEVKCRNSRCGAKAGVVVLHQFDIDTGELLRTERFADPMKREEVN